MAIPTFTSVSPNTGPAAGHNLIEIVGTNFRTPTVVYDVPVPDVVPTVSVTIGGVAALQVDVLSATRLRVHVPRIGWLDPRTDAYSAQAIVITNLDANGVPIPGETVTAPAAYTYARWVIGAPAADPPLVIATKTLIWSLMLEIERNVAQTTHVDYGEYGTAVEIDLARVPAVYLQVSTPRDIEYSQWDNYDEEVDYDTDHAYTYEGARTHMVVCNLLLVGEGSDEAMGMARAVEQYAQVNPLLPITFDDGTYNAFVEIAQDAQLVGAPNNSSLVVFSMVLQIRGISVFPSEPTEFVSKIQQFIWTLMNMDGENPQHNTVT